MYSAWNKTNSGVKDKHRINASGLQYFATECFYSLTDLGTCEDHCCAGKQPCPVFCLYSGCCKFNCSFKMIKSCLYHSLLINGRSMFIADYVYLVSPDTQRKRSAMNVLFLCWLNWFSWPHHASRHLRILKWSLFIFHKNRCRKSLFFDIKEAIHICYPTFLFLYVTQFISFWNMYTFKSQLHRRIINKHIESFAMKQSFQLLQNNYLFRRRNHNYTT